ncbi:MAG: DUF1064 domain-containing protein [Gemmataceae bacterium]
MSVKPRRRPPPRKRSRYGAKPVYVTPDGIAVGADHPGPKTKAFDSQSEFRRWQELQVQAAAGRICGLRKQVSFPLHATNGEVITRYRADFVYVENGRRIVEDRKGHRTAAYKMKRKWLKAEYGIDIRET